MQPVDGAQLIRAQTTNHENSAAYPYSTNKDGMFSLLINDFGCSLNIIPQDHSYTESYEWSAMEKISVDYIINRLRS